MKSIIITTKPAKIVKIYTELHNKCYTQLNCHYNNKPKQVNSKFREINIFACYIYADRSINFLC